MPAYRFSMIAKDKEYVKIITVLPKCDSIVCYLLVDFSITDQTTRTDLVNSFPN